MENRATIIFENYKAMGSIDLDIPLDITSNEFVFALNNAFGLDIDVNDEKKCFLKAENPFVLIKGAKTLEELGIRDGTKVIFK